MFYDIIIVGGGISGLYTLYKLSQKHPCLKILLLEKEKQLGGRVSTFIENGMVLEEGAGRFNDTHVLLKSLIVDLHLTNKIHKTSIHIKYMPDDKGAREEDGDVEDLSYYSGLLKILTGNDKPVSAKFILKIIIASMFESKEYLQKMNFIQYANKVLKKNQVKLIEDSFGYYKELHEMNAYNCIQLLNQLSPTNHNYILKGGLSQIINRMIENIKKNKNCSILTEQTVYNIQYVGEAESLRRETLSSSPPLLQITLKRGGEQKDKLYCNKIVCALPKEALEKIPIFHSIQHKLLDKITSASLCRIYSRFTKDKNGKYWFQHLPKITTNNALRMVIPYDLNKGIVMISYTDSHFADYWYRLYKSKGMQQMNIKIRELIKEITDIDIPKPIDTKIFYWKHGVGYWDIGADSEDVSNKMIKPFLNKEIYICGENYSGTFQQWIEGALETSEKVIEYL